MVFVLSVVERQYSAALCCYWRHESNCRGIGLL